LPTRSHSAEQGRAGAAGRLPRRIAAAPVEALRSALCYFTVLPVGRVGGPPALSASAPLLPAIGGAIGALAGLIGREAAAGLGRAPAAFLAVGALAGLAGAIHQDGLADLADGALAGPQRSRRLAVMAEGTVGAFAVLALLGWAIGCFAAAAALPRGKLIDAFLVAGCWSRAAALLQLPFAPPARREGLGASFSPSAAQVGIGVGLACALTLPTAGPSAGLLGAGLSLACAAAVGLWARRALGGRTGDTLGGAVALAELAILLGMVGLSR